MTSFWNMNALHRWLAFDGKRTVTRSYVRADGVTVSEPLDPRYGLDEPRDTFGCDCSFCQGVREAAASKSEGKP